MAEMELATEKCLPPMRPVFFDFDEDPNTHDKEDQFLFGADLLIAPITAFVARCRAVYLPTGTGWTDAWTGNVFSGGQTIHADAPIEHIPVYVRGDNPGLMEVFSAGHGQ